MSELPAPHTWEEPAAKYTGPAGELAQWWRDQAEAEIGPTVDKAHAYGSGDLVEIGTTLARIAGLDRKTSGELAELGVYFYLIGKMARWTSAIEMNGRVSDDTIADVIIYARMVQRIRAKGGWPA